jgi:hypothetical protein
MLNPGKTLFLHGRRYPAVRDQGSRAVVVKS